MVVACLVSNLIVEERTLPHKGLCSSSISISELTKSGLGTPSRSEGITERRF
jgi:hypothetical protein